MIVHFPAPHMGNPADWAFVLDNLKQNIDKVAEAHTERVRAGMCPAPFVDDGPEADRVGTRPQPVRFPAVPTGVHGDVGGESRRKTIWLVDSLVAGCSLGGFATVRGTLGVACDGGSHTERGQN